MTSRCERCQGFGSVYNCPRWPRCGCPGGTVKPDCPGSSAVCPECGGDVPLWRKATTQASSLLRCDEADTPKISPRQTSEGGPLTDRLRKARDLVNRARRIRLNAPEVAVGNPFYQSDCEFALEPSVVKLLDIAEEVGWDRKQVTVALIALSFKLAQDEDALPWMF